jgi:hypothetical protein
MKIRAASKEYLCISRCKEAFEPKVDDASKKPRFFEAIYRTNKSLVDCKNQV